MKESRPAPPPPLEANDQLVTVTGTAGWALALIVLLVGVAVIGSFGAFTGGISTAFSEGISAL